MTTLGTSIAQSVAGAASAERAAPAKKPERREQARRVVRREDELITSAPEVEPAHAVRGPQGNGDQDTHEDRDEQPGYTAQGQVAKNRPPNRLDLAG